MLAVFVMVQVPVPNLLTPLVDAETAVMSPDTTPLPEPPSSSGRLEPTVLEIVPESVSRPLSETTTMPVPPVVPTFMLPVSVVSPWRF